MSYGGAPLWVYKREIALMESSWRETERKLHQRIEDLEKQNKELKKRIEELEQELNTLRKIS